MQMSRKKISGYIDTVTIRIGNVICLLVIVMALLVATEVVLRYFFNRPTFWIWPINKQLFGIFVIFSGSYSMYYKSHIRIEMLYERLSGKLKTVARSLYLVSLVAFTGVLVWQGVLFGWDSFSVGERAVGQFRIPVYPLKLLIPVGALLLLLQGLVVVFKGED